MLKHCFSNGKLFYEPKCLGFEGGKNGSRSIGRCQFTRDCEKYAQCNDASVKLYFPNKMSAECLYVLRMPPVAAY